MRRRSSGRNGDCNNKWRGIGEKVILVVVVVVVVGVVVVILVVVVAMAVRGPVCASFVLSSSTSHW